jgi:hypothetical protein
MRERSPEFGVLAINLPSKWLLFGKISVLSNKTEPAYHKLDERSGKAL